MTSRYEVRQESEGAFPRVLYGFYGRLPRNAFIMIYRVCIDETSSHRERGTPLLLSGAVASVSNWERFNVKWHRMLNSLGVSYMRAHELVRCKGEFDGASVEEQLAAGSAADAIIRQHVRFGFSTVLWPQEFATYRDDTGSGLNSILDSDFGVSFRVALSFLQFNISLATGDKNPSVYILVEDGHENSGAAAEVFRQYKKQFAPDNVVKAVALVEKEECYGSQAADLRGFVYMANERQGTPQYTETSREDERVVRKMFEEEKPAWIRLQINRGELMDLRNSVILSRPKFEKRFGHLLVKNSSPAASACEPSSSRSS